MLDYDLYKDSFSTESMRGIWSEETTIATWLEVERCLARAQADFGLISEDAASRIERISLAQIDRQALREEMAIVGRPIVGLVRQMRDLAGDYRDNVHFRATTQDIMDTALALQMKQGLADIAASIHQARSLLDRHIRQHVATRILGRTNGQHAVPLLLATKLGVWHAELGRRLEAIEQAAGRGLNVQVGGPVGDLRNYGDCTGEQVKHSVAERLGLNVIDPHWQNARDGLGDIVTALGAMCATLCKISHNINLLASSDIGEVSETYSNGRGASSAMAHKRNQRASEFAEALARLGRQRSEQMGELTLHQHERSGGVWIGEWLLIPEVFLLASGALSWTRKMFDGLEVHEIRMRDQVLQFETSTSKDASKPEA